MGELSDLFPDIPDQYELELLDSNKYNSRYMEVGRM